MPSCQDRKNILFVLIRRIN